MARIVIVGAGVSGLASAAFLDGEGHDIVVIESSNEPGGNVRSSRIDGRVCDRAANGWLVPMDDLSAEYDIDDILPAMRGGLSYEGTMYAAPFYGESSMIMYRTDLMEKAGLEMPAAPSATVL